MTKSIWQRTTARIDTDGGCGVCRVLCGVCTVCVSGIVLAQKDPRLSVCALFVYGNWAPLDLFRRIQKLRVSGSGQSCVALGLIYFA